MRSTRFWLLIVLLSNAVADRAVSAETELDPVVADVVEMLGAKVDEGVILRWLDSTDRRPADVGSQGVIALTQAGASEDLITVLLDRVGEGDPAVSSARAAVETVSPASASESTDRSDGGSVEAVIQLRATQIWTDEDEPDSPREPAWWIYLYLDGDLVAWTRATLQGEPVEARRVIPAGRRELRVILQRYEQLRGGWSYESLSVPTLVGFEAAPRGAVEIDVEMKRIWGLWRQRQDGGPLSYVIRQGSRVLAEHGGTGGDPNRWQPVCEDVEANFSGSDTVPKRFRKAMSRCVRWSELWNGAGATTDRRAILEKLAADDFQPPVR